MRLDQRPRWAPIEHLIRKARCRLELEKERYWLSRVGLFVTSLTNCYSVILASGKPSILCFTTLTALVAYSHMESHNSMLWCIRHNAQHIDRFRSYIKDNYRNEPKALEIGQNTPSDRWACSLQQAIVRTAERLGPPIRTEGLYGWARRLEIFGTAFGGSDIPNGPQAPGVVSVKQGPAAKAMPTADNIAAGLSAPRSELSIGRTASPVTNDRQSRKKKRAHVEEVNIFRELYDRTSPINAGKRATNDAQPRLRLDQQSTLNHGERKLLEAFRECGEVRVKKLNARDRD